MEALLRLWPGVTLCLALGAAAAWPDRLVVAPGDVLVRWQSTPAAKIGAGGAPDAAAALAELERRYGPIAHEALFADAVPLGRPVAGALPRRDRLRHWGRLRVDAAVDTRQLAVEVARLPAVAEAQPNYLRAPCYVPDDPLVGDQWGLEATGWLALRPPDAGGIVVGVVDSGADYHHPDLREQIWKNLAEWGGEAGRDDDGNGYVDDVIGWDFVDAPGLAGSGDYLERDADPHDESGHGTHVAGIIAAGVGNGVGIAGLAPSVQLMVLRAGFNAAGAGYLADDDVAAAVIYGVENGAHILNLSFGDPHPAPVLRDALAYAHAAGVTVVAAAGNGGEEGVLYPARFSETIAVGAVTESGSVASFSSWGYEVDVAAPGLQIRSLAPGGGYVDLSGTSMAAAHVTGLSALVLARRPGLLPVQVRGSLTATARDAAMRGWDPWTGHGVATASPWSGVASGARFVYPEADQILTGPDKAILEVAPGDTAGSWFVAWAAVGAGLWTDMEETDGGIDQRRDFEIPPLPPGAYVLRSERRGFAAAPGAGAATLGSTTFATFRVAQQAPAIAGLSWSRVVRANVWAELVEWRTAGAAGGVVQVSGPATEAVYLNVPGGRADHWLVLPEDLSPGPYDLTIRADGNDAPAAALSLLVGERGLSSLPGERVSGLPDGYLLPELTDFDGDGRPEIAAMAASATGYGVTTLYEASGPGNWAAAYLASQTFIPWTAGDLDGDGLLELMVVDAERVRLLEAAAAGAFPARVVWEEREVWGGAVGDLDGDGRSEMHLRSSRGALMRVFENQGNDRHEAVALLANPTAGDNDTGERFVLADLDGDGDQEVFLGDGDGDLMLYSSVGDDALRWEWSGPGQGGDSRLVGGGADLDGDGRAEVAVGGFAPDPLDPAHSVWTVVVYEIDTDSAPRAEWELTVLGGRATRNGIAIGDLDGDGLPELVLGLPPNLYVVRADGPDRYRPVWWALADSPRRAVVGDVDGDGLGELAFSAVGEVAIVRFPAAPGRLPAPARMQAFALDAAHIALEWESVEGASHYLVRRDGVAQPAPVDTVWATTWQDGSVRPGVTHSYEVAAVSRAGEVGLWSAAVGARGGAAPRLIRAERLSATSVAAHFDSAMGASATEAHRYRLEPWGEVAASAILDREARRVVIAFPAWPTGDAAFLSTTGLRGARGTPLAAEATGVAVGSLDDAPPTRLLSAEARSSTEIALLFSAPLDSGLDPPAAVSVGEGAIEILVLRLETADVLVAELAPNTPVLAMGATYPVRVSGLRDARGRRIEGYAELTVTVASLDRVVVYPNPYIPGAGGLTIAPMPEGAIVTIATLGGQKIWAAEAGADGGVGWDGATSAGRRVGAGIYLYQVVHGDTRRLGKFAVVQAPVIPRPPSP